MDAETIGSLIATAIASVGGTKLFDRWQKRKNKLDILDEQMERIDKLSEKLLANESRLHEAFSENQQLKLELEKCKRDVQEWRDRETRDDQS